MIRLLDYVQYCPKEEAYPAKKYICDRTSVGLWADVEEACLRAIFENELDRRDLQELVVCAGIAHEKAKVKAKLAKLPWYQRWF